VPALQPWHWLTKADVQRLAVEAYQVATHDNRDLTDAASTPENFARDLQEVFETLLADAALAAGVPAAPFGAQSFASAMRADVPSDWKPQYPIFVTASAKSN
jgi:hypothetical protein